METTYNGWTNYETWVTALWIDNERETYEMRREWAQENHAAGRTTYDLATQIREYLEENNPLAGQSSLYYCLLGAALSEIDYFEIAENWLEDVDVEVEK